MNEPSNEGRRQIIGGRHGSPTITIAFPFSRVKSVDTELRGALVELADLIASLADVENTELEIAERETVARSARELAERLRGVS